MNKIFEYITLEDEYKEMLEKCIEITELSEKEIEDRINILEYINCSPNIIRNILVSNPNYLLRSIGDINNIINKLISLGIERIDITFDSNPWLLNYDSFEIDEFIKNKRNEGFSNDDILDLIDAGILE